MAARVSAVLEKPVARSMCKHHWLIEPPDGPISKGVCKLCGEVKVFDNVLEELLSNRDSVAARDSVPAIEPDGLSGNDEEDTEDDA
jgi:hypothetical protein